ncbi:hypothetical protein [Streptomyces sp. NPDC015131]|uniref:hypothetical protein n=1 Tax=Streptomyces sp. NPDC015131 TaxID=3364941 RepID=UPI0036F60E46
MPTTTEPVTDADAIQAEFFPAHYRCEVCYPDEGAWPIKAICGAELLGLPVPDGVPTCVACDRLLLDHLLRHTWERE